MSATYDDRIKHSSKPNDGFNVIGEYSLGEWLEYPVTDDVPKVTETIHLVPDPEGRELRLYRWVDRDDAGRNKRIKTVIPNVTFGFNIERDAPLTNWCLQNNGHTLLTILDGFYFANKGTPSDFTLNITYYEESGKGLFEGKTLGEESMHLTLKKDHDEFRRATITSTYRSNQHMMANFEGADPLVKPRS